MPNAPADESRVVLPERVEGAEVLLAHADRCWKAEEANSARIAARSNLVLSGVGVMLGLSLFLAGHQFDVVLASPVGARVALFWAAMAAAVVCLIVALFRVLFGARKPGQSSVTGDSASAGLHLNKRAADRPWSMPRAYSIVYVFMLTYRAALDLHKRNRAREASVDSAQKWLLAGVLVLFMAIVLYTSLAWDQVQASPSETGHAERTSSATGHSGHWLHAGRGADGGTLEFR